MRLFIHLALAAMVLGSCSMIGSIAERGNGVAVTAPIKVEGFSSISIPSSIDVVYTISDEEQSALLTCDENLLEYYDIHVEGNTLVADVKSGTICLSPKVKTVLAVSAPVLEGVKVSGSGDCTVHGDIIMRSTVRLVGVIRVAGWPPSGIVSFRHRLSAL